MLRVDVFDTLYFLTLNTLNMKKFSYLFVVLIVYLPNDYSYAQNALSPGDNYLRVVGNTRTVYHSNGIRLKIQLEGAQRDEYRKIRERTISDVMVELNSALFTIGYDTTQLKEIFPPHSYMYGQNRTKTYHLDFEDLDQVKSFYEIEIKGLRVIELWYLFDTSEKVDDFLLTKKAIESSKKKAEKLAKLANKKVGDILNIQDNSYHYQRGPREVERGDKQEVNYSITVTYELKDE